MNRDFWTVLVPVVIVIIAVIALALILFSPLFAPLGAYRVNDTKSYSGTVTEDSIYFEVDNFNGLVEVETWDSDEYKIDVRIEARGFSQEDAEKNLDDFKINFNENVVDYQERLFLYYDVPGLFYSRYSVEVSVLLPSDALIDLNIDSSNGGIYLTEIEGKNLEIETSNGKIVLNNVYAESITGVTSNGYIEGELEATDTFLSTSNGRIELTLFCTISGNYDIGTSNGRIELAVSSSSEVGYDLDLSTSNGIINIDLSNLVYSLNESTDKKAQSSGFDSKIIQLVIEADTSNGNIDINTF